MCRSSALGPQAASASQLGSRVSQQGQDCSADFGGLRAEQRQQRAGHPSANLLTQYNVDRKWEGCGTWSRDEDLPEEGLAILSLFRLPPCLFALSAIVNPPFGNPFRQSKAHPAGSRPSLSHLHQVMSAALVGAAAEARCSFKRAGCPAMHSRAVAVRAPQRQGPVATCSYSSDRQPLVIRAGQQPLMAPR